MFSVVCFLGFLPTCLGTCTFHAPVQQVTRYVVKEQVGHRQTKVSSYIFCDGDWCCLQLLLTVAENHLIGRIVRILYVPGTAYRYGRGAVPTIYRYAVAWYQVM